MDNNYLGFSLTKPASPDVATKRSKARGLSNFSQNMLNYPKRS